MTPTCRAATPHDEPFLRGLIEQFVATELNADQWPEPLRAQILQLQYAARMSAQRAQHPRAVNEIIEVNGAACGWLATAPLPGEVRLIDILVTPERRGQGIGTAVIEQVLARSAASGLPVTLHVAVANEGALRLYERLGFQRTGGDEFRHLMRSSPDA